APRSIGTPMMAMRCFFMSLRVAGAGLVSAGLAHYSGILHGGIPRGRTDAGPVIVVAMRLSEHDRPTRTHYALLDMSWAGWLFDFYDLVLYTFLIGPIGADLGLDRADHARVLGVSLGATAVGGLVFGALADRYGRRAVLQWTILTYSGGALACGLAPSM